MFSNKKFMYWMTEMTGHTVIFFPRWRGAGYKNIIKYKVLIQLYMYNVQGKWCRITMPLPMRHLDAFSKSLYIYELNKMVDHLI